MTNTQSCNANLSVTEHTQVDGNKAKPYTILLLTNRDSDNTGDQTIEACAIALLTAVMKNLGVAHFRIRSRAAGFIPKKYLTTRDESLLQYARGEINSADLVVFGGAPLFNYRYQVFYERTAVTLELAEEYGKPVIFSSIGVEGYDEDNEKCQRLKKTLNFDCVRQITTRDNFEALQQFVERANLPVAKVSDPAVFTRDVFKEFVKPKREKTIGIFVIRANAFVDNGIKFSRTKAAEMWVSLIAELEKRGYDYELLTSGHFGDEAFLDCLIQDYGINAKKCVFNMNTPEQLVEKISSYSAIVSCRLHPSIVAYSLGVPAVGIKWNDKVDYFYEAIGYCDRVIADDLNAIAVADKLEKVLADGVCRNDSYVMTVYQSLFQAIQAEQPVEYRSIEPYDHEALVQNIAPFKGTSDNEKNKKLERKFRRTYGKYNDISASLRNQKQTVKKLNRELSVAKRTHEETPPQLITKAIHNPEKILPALKRRIFKQTK